MNRCVFPFVCLFLSLPAFAAGSDADKALLPVPAQTTAEAPVAAAIANRFSLGVGSGVNSFGGNMGKLYSTSSPVVEARGEWAFSPIISARGGVDFVKYSFNASPNGAVNVSTNSIQAAAQCHYLSTAMSGSGFDPYVSAGAAQVFRTQTFLDHNAAEKDNAFALSAGIGTNYLPAGARVGFWAEADAGKIFFADRFTSSYLASGIEDLTGTMYSARLGMKYVF
jgi:hypothetical protein